MQVQTFIYYQICLKVHGTASYFLVLVVVIGVARGGHGREFALPSLNFALPSKPSSYLNCT